nr:hypothetical protein [Tanacetum cinerariifolium]
MDDELDTNRTNILNDDSDDEGVDEVLILDDRNGNILNDDSDDEGVDEVLILDDCNGKSINKGASTPNTMGTRIILGWNRNDVDVAVITQDDQAVHTRIWLKQEKKELFCSIIYAHNGYNQRRLLWKALNQHKCYVRNCPWCLLGDFNATLYLEESTSSSSRMDIAMREFKECVDNIEVLDVPSTGLQYTWNQKPRGLDGIFKKLDRIMANMDFLSEFVGTHAIFKPYRNSDHSPFILCIPMKLKNMKKPLRRLLFEKGNLHANVIRLRAELDQIQSSLDKDPFNLNLREQEATCVVDFNQALIVEEKFFKQKAKILWLKEEDSISAYFHKTVKKRLSRSRIDVVMNGDGVIFANETVPNAFVSHYEMFLGQAGISNGFDDSNLFKVCLNDQDALHMVRSVTDREVKDAIFSMGDDKSPGPDGYTVAFFKDAWLIVGDEVTKAIREFFVNGRSISDNILLTQELMHNYHLDRGTPRCAFKVDIQKAYDTVECGFLRKILIGFGFHDRMIAWIMECVETTSYSISINGNLHGYFQGDPLSPYLFTLVMEVLTLMIKRRVEVSNNFSYHRYCDKLELINLCFADDLFLFAYGDVQSASII